MVEERFGVVQMQMVLQKSPDQMLDWKASVTMLPYQDLYFLARVATQLIQIDRRHESVENDQSHITAQPGLFPLLQEAQSSELWVKRLLMVLHRRHRERSRRPQARNLSCLSEVLASEEMIQD